MPRPRDPDPATQAMFREFLLKREKLVEPRPLINPRSQADDRAPLSFSQERLWFLSQLEPGTSYHNLPILLHVSGPLNRQVLANSFQEVVRRHEILRTVFMTEDGRPIQVALPHMDLSLPTIDLTNLPVHEQEMESSRLTQEFASLGFDTSHVPLIRGILLAFGPSTHQLLVVMHHIVSDSWSLSLLIQEVSALYEAFLKGRPSPLPELPIQYADFAVWQRVHAGEILEAQLTWWREYLAGAPTLLELPTDRPRPQIDSFRSFSCRLSLDNSLVESLRTMVRREGVTLFILMLASWAVVLSRHANQDDVLLGTPIAGRTVAETAELIGPFVNTLVSRISLQNESNFTDLLRRVRESTLGAFAHQAVPFVKLVDEFSSGYILGRSPLFQVMIGLQSVPNFNFSPSKLIFTPTIIDTQITRHDLILSLQENGNEEPTLEGTLKYAADLFDSNTAKRILARFQVLLQGIVDDPSRRLTELPLLTQEEQFQLAFAWDVPPPPHAEPSLFHRFQAQAALCPDEIAIVQRNRHLTFSEVSLQAQRLAIYLRSQGVRPEVIVGLQLGRSPELVIAALAVLAAGGAYLPLDSSYPEERKNWILADARASLVISGLPSEENLGRQKSFTIPEINPENLAYVLYISGSTGHPKGVMVQHRALMLYIDWAIQAYEVEGGQGTPVHSSLMHDLTVTSFWVPLLAGRTLTLLPEEKGLEALSGMISPGADFSLVKLTPSELDQLVEGRVLPDFVAGWTRSLILGGEELRGESLTFWREHAPATRIFNEYGPAETVVACSAYQVRDDDFAIGSVPIGQPISGAHLYVLDKELNLAPIGVIGELWIGGESLARGYLGRPDLTAARFLPDPFSAAPGARMYRSGDLVRRRADDVLEHRGRNDRQLKIHGFRVEPGEIEANLGDHPRVRQAVVMARQDRRGESRLVAYVTGEELPLPSEFETFLARRLPKHMMPEAFVNLPALPLTPSGKIDATALPQPETRYVAPRTPIEALLADIWADLLGLDHVGVEHNFFELGGHSLLATRILSRTQSAVGVDLPLSAIFESPSISELAKRLHAEHTLSHYPDPISSELDDSIDSLYDEMIALVRHHGNHPGLKEALRPLRKRLEMLQEIEAQRVAEEYDSHFQPDYEQAQTLLAQAQKLLNKK